jgi:hypothetical protein
MQVDVAHFDPQAALCSRCRWNECRGLLRSHRGRTGLRHAHRRSDSRERDHRGEAAYLTSNAAPGCNMNLTRTPCSLHAIVSVFAVVLYVVVYAWRLLVP